MVAYLLKTQESKVKIGMVMAIIGDLPLAGKVVRM
jgi:hypothetical protein